MVETIGDENTLENVSQLRLPALDRGRASARLTAHHPRRRRALPIVLAGILGASACFVDSPAVTGAATAPPATSSSSSSTSSVETSASEATMSPTLTSSASVGSTSESTGSPTSSSGSTMTGCETLPLYRDEDEDGYGDPETPLEACEAPGYVDNSLDCDDSESEINPGADELCDMIDNDCDQVVDEWSPANELCGGCSMYASDDSVYHVCAEMKYNFATARARCQERGGDLVVIETLAEGMAIFDLVDNGGLSSWLIGLTDADSEGSFVWVDGTPLVPGQSNWSANEPNDSMMNEDCVALTTLGTWNDIDCAIPRPMICEVPL